MLLLDDQTRAELWPRVVETIETYLTQIETARAAPLRRHAWSSAP